MYLYHYFEKATGPFRNLSDLSVEAAQEVVNKVKEERPGTQCATRHDKYVQYRRNCENILRNEFAKKGGKMERNVPHYMTVEHSPWLSTWFEDGRYIKIPIEEFDLATLSFTYGDSMPNWGVKDDKEYRGKLYTYEEIIKVIEKYGLPQNWNDDGKQGPERYIEVQVWSDEPINKYLKDKGEKA